MDSFFELFFEGSQLRLGHMILEQLLNRHRLASVMIVGYDFAGNSDASDDSGYFPLLARVALDHYPYVEWLSGMAKQRNAFLHEVVLLYLRQGKGVKSLVKAAIKRLRVPLCSRKPFPSIVSLLMP